MAEVVQRLVIQPWIRLRPSSKDRVLTRWMRGLARMALWILRRIGGAKLEVRPTVPAGPGVLVVMNHQSLLDIPMATASVEGGYPRFVTRKRYEKGIPLISHLLKILDCPLVDPGSGDLEQIRRLQVVGRTTTQPLVIFPEGTRSRTGRLLPFKKGGFHLAMQGRSVIVPVAIQGAAAAMRKGSPIIRPVTVSVRLGPPIDTTDRAPGDRDALIADTRAAIQGLLDQGPVSGAGADQRPVKNVIE